MLEMQVLEPYNELVQALFARPEHAGDLDGEYVQSYSAEVAASDQGLRIVLAVGVVEEKIAQMRFRAWACPHVIAAAEWLCADRESSPVSMLEIFEQNEIMRRLSIPTEKIGRILLLEDALTLLAKQWLSGSDIGN